MLSFPVQFNFRLNRQINPFKFGISLVKQSITIYCLLVNFCLQKWVSKRLKKRVILGFWLKPNEGLMNMDFLCWAARVVSCSGLLADCVSAEQRETVLYSAGHGSSSSHGKQPNSLTSTQRLQRPWTLNTPTAPTPHPHLTSVFVSISFQTRCVAGTILWGALWDCAVFLHGAERAGTQPL